MTLPEAVQAEFRRQLPAIEALTKHPVTLEQPEEGRYRILRKDGMEVARFRLRRSLQCSGVVVPYGVVVDIAYRGRGLGQLLERLRLNAAKEAGFGLGLMTTRADNENQNHIASKAGWQPIAEFHNNFTHHNVRIWIIYFEDGTSEGC